MSWGTTINNVFLNRIGKKNVNAERDDNEETMRGIRDELMMFVGAAPRDIVEEDGGVYKWEEYARHKTSELIEAIEDYSVRIYQCSLLIESDENDIVEDE